MMTMVIISVILVGMIGIGSLISMNDTFHLFWKGNEGPNGGKGENTNDATWIPSFDARIFMQMGTFPWYRGGNNEEGNLGVYIEQASGTESLGTLASTIVEASTSVTSKMNETEVLSLAKSYPRVAQFLESNPEYQEYAFFDGEFWHVDFYMIENWDDWAYIMIKDERREIIQVYVVQGESVYLEWPNADLTIEKIIDLINDDVFTSDFMQAFNRTMMDAWIWFDGEDTWYVYFLGWPTLWIDEARNNSPESNPTTTPSFNNDLEPAVPSSENDMNSAIWYSYTYWLTTLISDDASRISETFTNYYNYSAVQHVPEEMLPVINDLNITKSFMERNKNTSLINEDHYLKILHASDGSISIQWWFEFQAWPPYFYYPASEVTGLPANPIADKKHVTSSKTSNMLINAPEKELISSSLDGKNKESFLLQDDSSSMTLPDGIVSLYFWKFDYLKVALADEDASLVMTEEARQPSRSMAELLTELTNNDTSIRQFIEEMEETSAYLAFDPFIGTWYLSLSPTWTSMGYLWAIINDTNLNIIELESQTVSEELRPTMRLSEVRDLLANLSVYQQFNDTYAPYGHVSTWIYYYTDYYNEVNNGTIGNTITEPVDEEGSTLKLAKTWTIWVSSDVLIEAWVFITINDSSQSVISTMREDPILIPTLYPENVLNITKKLPEVINFTSSYPAHEVFLSYYLGDWQISYYYFRPSDYTYAYVFVTLNDATATVTEIYVYP